MAVPLILLGAFFFTTSVLAPFAAKSAVKNCPEKVVLFISSFLDAFILPVRLQFSTVRLATPSVAVMLPLQLFNVTVSTAF